MEFYLTGLINPLWKSRSRSEPTIQEKPGKIRNRRDLYNAKKKKSGLNNKKLA